MGQNIQLHWGVSRVAAATLDLLEDEERRCLDLSILQISVLRQMAYPWVLVSSRLVEDHGEYQTVVEMPVAYLEALEELEILLSGAYDGPVGGCPVGEEYVDRGDPLVWDFYVEDLAVDSAWHSLDLGGIITDADATCVHLGAQISSAVVGRNLIFRETNNVNSVNLLRLRTFVPGILTNISGRVTLGPDRSLDYYATAGLEKIEFAVRGWWRPAT